ncbi:penicillin-binding protein 1A [Jejuia pallidilutea]|uniref:Penicillin-binding protein 1A n=1 Tax=Jejuia pallidilutea TaxID=504487 RepID=A0A362XEQ4_9FLAO|nr:transglycosylase domain-containing protein [Jejuia pallidilutea]PQV51720.1 penicillin-binding protein 1A [Jejuia pallidilutea]
MSNSPQKSNFIKSKAFLLFVWSRNILGKKWVKWSLIGLVTVVFLLVSLFVSVYCGAFGNIPSKKDLTFIRQEAATQVLDKNGRLIGKYFIYDRQPLTYKDFPQHLIDALIATEDIRFYQHDGIDNKSLVRVFLKTILMQDESAGGGSTITLQLAKNLFGRKQYIFASIVINKLRESIIAKRIEDIYSKKEILELYLNTVPFPDNTYGIESAARKFFNKSTTSLNKQESAVLVGTLKANNYYNPRLYPKRSKARRNVVLNQMVKYGYLSKDTADILIADTLKLEYRSFNHDVGIAPYFREQVKKELTLILDSLKKPDGQPYDMYRDGLQVHTTLDYAMQELAEEAMKEHMAVLQKDFESAYGNNAPWKQNGTFIKNIIKQLPLYKKFKEKGLSDKQIEDTLNTKRNVEVFSWDGDTIARITVRDSLQHFVKFLNTGMLSIDPSSGAVRTYIGGIDYRFFKYDHVSQSERQVGSTFKPFVYTAAIENGMKPCTYFPLKAVSYVNYDDWTPTNSGSEEEAPHLNYSLEKALSNSVNTIAVKVLNEVGIPKVVDLVEKLGIVKTIPNEPSIALGVAEINLKALTGAFASYVNAGKAVKPYCIKEVRDRYGKVLVSFKPEVKKVPAFNDYTQQVVLEMMKTTVNSGTASRLRNEYKLRNEIAGKTGTTQNNKDGWFVGITPKLVSVTWVGNDNHSIGFSSTGIGQGANSALPIFAKFYKKLNEDEYFNAITKAEFKTTSYQALEDLKCEPEKRDGFLKRLFGLGGNKKRFKGE